MTWDTLLSGMSALVALGVVASILWQDREEIFTRVCDIMSHKRVDTPTSLVVRPHPDAVGPQTDGHAVTDRRTDTVDNLTRQHALRRVLQALRAAGVDRQEARQLLAALAGGKLGFSNEVWSDAAPAVSPGPLAYTPIGQRPYDPSRYPPRTCAEDQGCDDAPLRPMRDPVQDDRATEHA